MRHRSQSDVEASGPRCCGALVLVQPARSAHGRTSVVVAAAARTDETGTSGLAAQQERRCKEAQRRGRLCTINLVVAAVGTVLGCVLRQSPCVRRTNDADVLIWLKEHTRRSFVHRVTSHSCPSHGLTLSACAVSFVGPHRVDAGACCFRRL